MTINGMFSTYSFLLWYRMEEHPFIRYIPSAERADYLLVTHSDGQGDGKNLSTSLLLLGAYIATPSQLPQYQGLYSD